jgi:CRISPR/Cas system-associated protein Cas5 (RAMP superfamily)
MESFQGGKYIKTTLLQSYPLPAGTTSTGSLSDSIAAPTEFKSCARNATAERPRRKIVSEERTQKLRGRLKDLLDEEKKRQVARQIEVRSHETLGDYHFAFGPEAKKLAEVDLALLKNFIAEVERIRMEADTDYYFATKALIGEDDASNS